MNRYPLWRYLLVAGLLLISVIYTLPNFFGEVPAVQVSPLKVTAKIDAAVMGTVEQTLKASGIALVCAARRGLPVARRPQSYLVKRDHQVELGVEVVVVAPPAESDVQAQITQVEDLIAQGIDGLAIAPPDPNALAPVVESARAAGIPASLKEHLVLLEALEREVAELRARLDALAG